MIYSTPIGVVLFYRLMFSTNIRPVPGRFFTVVIFSIRQVSNFLPSAFLFYGIPIRLFRFHPSSRRDVIWVEKNITSDLFDPYGGRIDLSIYLSMFSTNIRPVPGRFFTVVIFSIRQVSNFLPSAFLFYGIPIRLFRFDPSSRRDVIWVEKNITSDLFDPYGGRIDLSIYLSIHVFYQY
jgi:hypothetical protein